MIYEYQACTTDRRISEGAIEAISEKMAEDALYQAGFTYVLDLKEKKKKKTFQEQIPTIFGIKNSDIIEFSRQTAVFLESGSTLLNSLELLREQTGKTALKILISEIIDKLEAGNSFSQAIADHPDIFPRYFRHTIQSSEKTGEISGGLNQVADYMENQSIIGEKIKRAMIYPAFIMLMAIGVVIMLVTTVLPPIIRLFSSFKMDLPYLTTVSINVINFITDNKYPLIFGVLMLVLAGLAAYKLPSGRKMLDRFILSIPGLGIINLNHNLGQFCRTTALLIKAGLSLPQVMEVSIQAAGNQAVKSALENVREELIQGEGFSLPLSRNKLFPPMMVKMVNVGEQTGTLDTSFETLAKYYENYTNKRLQNLIGLIEPTLIIIIGISIAFVMFAMIVPIYNLMGHM